MMDLANERIVVQAKMIPSQRGFYRYTFRDYTGYVIAPWILGVDHALVTIRHSAAVPPWRDRDLHRHTHSEEYYFLVQGELQVLVGDAVLTPKPYEVLMIKPSVPHALVGGTGPIEHFVLRMLAAEDRQVMGRTPADAGAVAEGGKRILQGEWGCRVPLAEARYQNCWLFGVGEAHFHSSVMCLAYVVFPTAQSLATDRHPHRLHLHRESWEFYVVLRGTRVLRIEQELVEIGSGEILAVPPRVKHVLHSTEPPCESFEFRVPRLNDKVEF